MHFLRCFLLMLAACFAEAQVFQFPYRQNFDSVSAPALPPGWTTTANRSPSGDFTTTRSTFHSDSNSVFSTNAKIAQWLISPLLDFSNKESDTLEFWERRSSSHNSGLLIEASIDGGSTFTIAIGDTLKNPGITSYVLRRLKLDSALNNRPAVKIRWRVTGDGTGASGTIRFDDIAISALANTDAALKRITFSHPYPIVGDSIIICATIENTGLRVIQNVVVEFYEDRNYDSLPQPDELFSSVVIDQQIVPNDTCTGSARLYGLTYGGKCIIAKCVTPGDQNFFNDSKKEILSVGIPPRSLVVNEIMYAPDNPEPEWIELYNAYCDTVDLCNWKISNRNIVTKYLLSRQQTMFKPKGYCVITKDIALFAAIHPDATSKLIQVNSMPAYTFNNTGDAVVLFDHRGALMDSVHYFAGWGGLGGKSLERIEYCVDSNDPANWKSSGDSLGSTPGAQNYYTPLEYDLRISAVRSSITAALIEVVIKNAGHKPANAFSVSLFYDANQDSIPETSELIETKNETALLAFKDSLTINFNWKDPPSGRKLLIAVVDYPGDLRLSDNIFLKEVKNSFPPQTLVINEIMYEPKTGDAEYVELFNPGGESIDISEWRMTDFSDTTMSKKHIISQPSLIIRSKEYFVVAFDSSIFTRFSYLLGSIHNVMVKNGFISLNNEGDRIILTDLTGETMDSVHYLPSWHNPDVEDATGRALERINPYLPGNDKRNWSTSANPFGGSPGRQNSLYTISAPGSAAVSFTPNPFSPGADGFEDVTIIKYELPATTALIKIRIYDSNGRLVRTLAENEPAGSHGETIWDGYNNDRQRVRMGIYVVLLEALDNFGGTVHILKAAVVVAAKMK